jgi:hypothetical protein
VRVPDDPPADAEYESSVPPDEQPERRVISVRQEPAEEIRVGEVPEREAGEGGECRWHGAILESRIWAAHARVSQISCRR